MRHFLFLYLAVLANASLCADRGAVTFYAPFDGTTDAVAIGDGKAQDQEIAPKFEPGKRGQALLSGDGIGYLGYAAAKNLPTDRASIELWVSPQAWSGGDSKFHVFLEAENPSWLVLYKYYGPGAGMSLTSFTFTIVRSTQRRSRGHSSMRRIGQRARMSPSDWRHRCASKRKRSPRSAKSRWTSRLIRVAS